MPFYEYQCKACGAHHEAMQKMSDAPLKKCPECGKNSLQRLVSAPVFRLKGGGWYETDFKSDQETKRNLAAEEKAEKSDAGEKAESKADAKADAKPADAKSGEKVVSKPASKPVAKPVAKPAKAKPVGRRPAAKAPAKKVAKRR